MKKTACFLVLLMCAAVILSISFSVENSRAADSSKIAVAYSGNIMGYFESCG